MESWWPRGELVEERTGFLVSLRCCNKMPQTGSLRNNKHLLFTVLEARSPRLAQSGSGDSPLGCRQPFSHRVLTGQSARELCGVSSVRTLIPCMRAPPSCPSHLPKAPPPNTITFQHAFGGVHSVRKIRLWLGTRLRTRSRPAQDRSVVCMREVALLGDRAGASTELSCGQGRQC